MASSPEANEKSFKDLQKKLPRVLDFLFLNDSCSEKNIEIHKNAKGQCILVDDILEKGKLGKGNFESHMFKAILTEFNCRNTSKQEKYYHDNVDGKLCVVFPNPCGNNSAAERDDSMQNTEVTHEPMSVDDTAITSEAVANVADEQNSGGEEEKGASDLSESPSKRKKKSKNKKTKASLESEKTNAVTNSNDILENKADNTQLTSSEASEIDTQRPAKKKGKHSTPEGLARTLKYLFEKNGLEEKNISRERDGSVSFTAIYHQYEDQFGLSENEVRDMMKDIDDFELISNNKGYFVKYKNDSKVSASNQQTPDSASASAAASLSTKEPAKEQTDLPHDQSKPSSDASQKSNAASKKNKGKKQSTDRISKPIRLFFERNLFIPKHITAEQDGSVPFDKLYDSYKKELNNCSKEEMKEAVSNDPALRLFNNNNGCFISYVDKQARGSGNKIDQAHMQQQQHGASQSRGPPSRQEQIANRQSQYTSNRGPGGQYNDRRNYQGQRDGQNYYNNRDGRPRESDIDIYLSKTMSYLLRHGAQECHMPIRTDGFMAVDDLLWYRPFKQKFTLADVERVVKNNAKKRFDMICDEQGRHWVRANQGHTLDVKDLELRPITDAAEFPIVVHGTYHDYWEQIRQTGLSIMDRNHIHLARGLPGASGVISGMRSDCDLLIYINMEQALKDGFKFFLSSNDVILCPGDRKGFLPPAYFSDVTDRNGCRIE